MGTGAARGNLGCFLLFKQCKQLHRIGPHFTPSTSTVCLQDKIASGPSTALRCGVMAECWEWGPGLPCTALTQPSHGSHALMSTHSNQSLGKHHSFAWGRSLSG